MAGKRSIEDYFNLAEYDYKCLRNDSIKNDSIRNPVCCNDEQAEGIIRKELFEIIDKREKWEEGKKCTHEIKIAGKSEKCSFFSECNDNKSKSKPNYEMWKAWKKKKGPDPDDSGRGNAFVRSIYHILWGKRIGVEHGWGNFTTSYLKFQDSEKLLWGGDTINTLASYRVQIEMFRCEEGNKENVDKMCSRCHRLGNFVLVPAYFNAWRGFKLQDRMDLAFYVLSEMEDSIDQEKNVDDIFSMKALFYENQKGEDDTKKAEKWDAVKEKFSVWKKEYFIQYVNTFFLWDYVEKKEEKYVVKNLQYSEMEEEKSKYITADTIGTYIDNVNTYIERRSIFMTGMLMIALEFKEPDKETDKWKDWKVSSIYKLIMDEVFLKDKPYSGYEKVIEKIEETIENNKDKEFVNKISAEIQDILSKMCERMGIK